MQLAIMKVYELIEDSIFSGKQSFLRQKWASRSVEHSSRNVGGSIALEIHDLDNTLRAKPLSTIVGLYQYCKSVVPLFTSNISTMFLDGLFLESSNIANLIDSKTMKRKHVELTEKERSIWTTTDGLEKMLNKLVNDKVKDKTVLIDGNYLILVYDYKEEIRLLKEIDDLPAELDRQHVRGITYGELLFLSIYKDINKYYGYIARYPVIEDGSIIPTPVYVKSSVKGRSKTIYKTDGTLDGKTLEYIKLNTNWVNNILPATGYYDGLGYDNDGDMISLHMLLEEESIKEISDYLESTKAYLNSGGKLTINNETLTNKIIMLDFTGE